jgi:hypothetical protein
MNICFIDTETTSLRPDRRAWEIGLIIRNQHGDAEHRWFVAAEDLDLGNADLMSLKIGGFYDRHPDYAGRLDTEPAPRSERDVLRRVDFLTRGAHLVGALPSFDAEVLGNRMRAHGICPSWHYHLIDIEPLAIGYLCGQAKPVPDLPWNSDYLSRLIGEEPPQDDERHTALGDARWVKRIWDAILPWDYLNSIGGAT